MALVAKSIEYDVHDPLNPKRSNPPGKLPYLEPGGRGYEDSTHIVRTLDEISEADPCPSQHGPDHAGDARPVDLTLTWRREIE